MERLRVFFTHSFQRKLTLFNLVMVVFTAIVLFAYLMNNFQTITDFSLEQNTASMEQTVEAYLNKYTQEKAASIWFQMKAAQDNLSVLGRTAQKILDNYDEINASAGVLELSLFQTRLREENGALSGDKTDLFDTLIPPAIVSDPDAQKLLKASALLNLSLDAAYDANSNNAFMYFVGNPKTPVTRAYPNIHLAEVLGDGLQLLFWRDYFAQNVESWTKWYTDPALQSRIPSPITIEPPYVDAAGQGSMISMFYPLWDKKTNQFAGAVGADITLSKIVENVLGIRVARTGFAFLMNGDGEIIAMPEAGFKLFKVNLTETRQGGLTYYTGALYGSSDADVKGMAATILASQGGVLKIVIGSGAQISRQLVAYASLPAFSNNHYQEDRWQVVVVVPEAEIFESLNSTDTAIRNRSLNIGLISFGLVSLFTLVVAFISIQFSNNVTRDLRTLAQVAEQVSAKNYNVTLKLSSQDEIGQLGRVFENMTHEIREYTDNLESMVVERTADLKTANGEITRLNEQLKGENLRLGAELDVARRLQMMVLPHESETQDIQDLDIACYMRPADEVGGDYYDVLKMGDSAFIGIGDVTGHGLSAGVVMLMAQTSLLTLSESGEKDMKRILSVMNHVLYRNIIRIREDKNMTLAVLYYNNHEFVVVGQHETVIICRAKGGVEIIDTVDLGLPVGLEDNIDQFIFAHNLRLDPEDVMVLYTDGVTEAEQADHTQFGLNNLADCLPRYKHLNAQEILDHVLADLYAFIGDARIYDDISMLVIKQE